MYLNALYAAYTPIQRVSAFSHISEEAYTDIIHKSIQIPDKANH